MDGSVILENNLPNRLTILTGGAYMILLLGKNDVIEEYAKETLKVDMRNDIVYYPEVTTHYTELDKYVEIAKEEEPCVITTQSLEMIDILLTSDLDLQVITVYKNRKGLHVIIKTKEEAWQLREEYGLDLR